MQYALITAARNEVALIEATLCAVISQTVKPVRWVICSDGSTDGTDDIVRRYGRQFPSITLMRMPEHRERNFAAKVSCLMAAYKSLRDVSFDVIANLDADVTFEPDYIEFLLERLAGDPKLGVVGTLFMEGGRQKYDYRFINEAHVTGCCQVFRRACFEDINGYLPLQAGGEDWAAVTMARMRGWKTQCYKEKLYTHHRTMGSATHHVLRIHLRQGSRDYMTGSHTLWQLSRSMFQMSRRPYILGGACLMLGYLLTLLRGTTYSVPEDLRRFHRAEQMARLRRLLPWSKQHGTQQ